MANVITALKVRQWLDSWQDAKNSDTDIIHRIPNEPYFYMFSIRANALKRLSGVYKREVKNRATGAEDLGIQRKHDPERSQVIKDYVINGYPWSELSANKRASGKFNDLKKPGWLPTAIVLNILTKDDVRKGKSVDPVDLITIDDVSKTIAEVKMPDNFNDNSYTFKALPPIEIIDGQHRLWAFDDKEIDDDYELPVVAFHGLGLSWQAYLFYTINISPKKINRSLAFDLYPLLRNEDWLERFDGHNIYKEVRAQEIVDILNSHEESPWYDWVNMLGESDYGIKKVSQAAWIRTLTATLIRTYEGSGIRLGGLFGAPVGLDKSMLPWGRDEQSALIIRFGIHLKKAIKAKNDLWAQALRDELQDVKNADYKLALTDNKLDPAFYGKESLLNQDQGIRVIMHVLNDFAYLNAQKLNLDSFYLDYAEGAMLDYVSQALKRIKELRLDEFLEELSGILAGYDWRSFNSWSVSKLDNNTRNLKASFRGSGGYRTLRIDVLNYIRENGSNIFQETATEILEII